MKLYLSILFTLLIPFSLHAQTVANITIPDSIPHSDSTKKLLLNGAGIRSKFIFDIYVGALYLEKKQNSATAIYQLAGNKRIHMHFLYDEISKEKLVKAWNDGFSNNHSNQELISLKNQINQFNSLFTSVNKGDVIDLNFIPDTGTSIVINGKSVGTVKGNEFFTAILKIWLGDEPADTDLKDAMLGMNHEQ